MATEGHDDGVCCPVCGEQRFAREMIPGSVLNDATRNLLQARNADWSHTQAVCVSCLARVHDETQPALDPDPTPDARSRSPRQHLHEEMLQRRKFGERVSDQVASFVGSWTFLNTQFILLLLWVAFNSIIIFKYRFDPYPFIFLNLVLSWLAALQAPLILMSQNRQDARDRLRDESAYHTSVAAELEVHQLQEKLDHLISDNWPLLIEIHHQQVELAERLRQQGA